MTRRELCIAAVSLLACAHPSAPTATNAFDDLEKRVGGRVGVAAIDTSTGKRLSHRGGERFAMCSTFKWLLAAAVLARVDRGEIALAI